jgi:hypothetical protein
MDEGNGWRKEIEERDGGLGGGGKGRSEKWWKETKERGGGKEWRYGMKEGREDKRRNERRNG